MFVLVHKNKVLVGPMKWHPSMFAGALKKIGIDAGFPRYAPKNLPLIVDSNTKVYEVSMTYTPHNSRIEYLEGPVWDFSGEKAVGSHLVKDRDIDYVKRNLIGDSAVARYNKEDSTVNVTVQGQNLVVSTSRESRSSLSLLLSTIDNTCNYKSKNNIWIAATKNDLTVIATAINNYIQDLYDEEKDLVQRITQCSTLAELADIEIVRRAFN